MRNLLKPEYWRITSISVIAACYSIGQTLSRMSRQQSQALRRHLDAAQARLVVAGQAGDFSTLINDQLDLIPESRRRLQSDWQAARLILAGLQAELMRLWLDYRQRMRAAEPG